MLSSFLLSFSVPRELGVSVSYLDRMWPSARTVYGIGAAVIIAACGAAGNHAVRSAEARRTVPTMTSYEYHGCPVFRPGDWLTSNIQKARVAPNSDQIIRNLIAAFGVVDFSRNVTPNEEGVNIVNSANLLATPVILGLEYGFSNNVYNDDPPPHRIEINRGTFMQEGTANCAQPGRDCHVNVLDTDRCIEYETYRSGGLSWNGSTYTAEGGGVENLRHPYQIEHLTVTAAQLPMMGTADWGEDLRYQNSSCRPNCAIPHVLAFYLPTAGLATKGHVKPAAGEAQPCTSGPYCNKHALPYGARLRLKSSYPCPKYRIYPQANLLCNQAKQYGWIFTDTTGVTGMGGVRLGLSSDSSNPWSSSDYNEFLTRVRLQDFEVLGLKY